jgi:spermidine/putrescine transport system permease protein
MPERRTTLLLLAPATLIFLGLFVAPSIYYFIISFWTVKLFKMRPDFTFANYGRAFTDAHLPTLILTLGLGLSVALLTTVLGFIFAYIIRFKAGRWGPLLLFVALLTLFGGYLMKIYAWKTILGTEGVLNTALIGLGLISQPLTFLFYNPGAVVVTLIHFLLPLAILPIYSSMRGISDIELEAARDLGAGGWRGFSDIVVPRSRTGLMAAFALSFLVGSGDYVTPVLVGGTMNMTGNQIVSQFGQIFNWPMGSALSFVLLGASLLIIMLFSVLLGLWRPR